MSGIISFSKVICENNMEIVELRMVIWWSEAIIQIRVWWFGGIFFENFGQKNNNYPIPPQFTKYPNDDERNVNGKNEPR